MFNGFSNETTARVYDLLLTKPDLYEMAVSAARQNPKNAPQEIRSWVTDTVKSTLIGDDGVRDLVNASLRIVRWEEIRQALNREASA